MVTSGAIGQRDLDMAEKIAIRANETAKGKNSDILDTLARVFFMQGKKEPAIQLQAQAVMVAEDEKKLFFQKTLDSYRKGELPKP